ncbi:alpha-hydroxy-acid oxidizing protein [Winogradskyella sp. DF17]|uniref:Alpha-hydroxy-acid oxidizing protein n=1 Tax=Winogradskyella pelagia TaxID=2819984 RepID=A0ABS3T067_9FLAO|nr:alpha-hydroxy acid oxidase [Winogradskyella sp. DF17]MBO3116129.1 alpha-hydroxy-acid oxidizing protein [Winogradskyella sp. DF17]
MSYETYQKDYSNKFPAIEDLAIKAKSRIPHVAWEYLESGTGSEYLLQRNKEAFEAITFTPQFCKGHIEVDVSTQLFGQSYSCPIGIAPVGLTGLMWPKAEHYLAAAAKRYTIPFCLSTVATETPETIGPLVGNNGWFQLYPPKELDLTVSLLNRAKASGFHTLVVTADVPMASRRERTKRAGMTIPPKITPQLIWQGLTHPVWTYETLKHGLPRLRTVEQYTNTTDFKFVSGFVGNRLGGTLDWQYCQKLKALWDGPVVLKGVLHPDDAQRAIDIGLDGIWVSNHGGRQFNGAPASIEALPDIAAMVGNQVPIIFDSGIRTGLDIMRALYEGANFVMLGRPFLYGIAALGTYGADHVIHILKDDLKNNMVQLGITSIEELKSHK